MPTAIVTDSTSDIPLNLLQKHQIYQVPIHIEINQRSFEDGFNFSRADFYDQLPRFPSLPTTAAPSAGKFQQIYERLLTEGFSEVISIHAAADLSGIYNAARLAAKEFRGRVQVVDSKQLSLGLGFQVLSAARAAAEQIPADKIITFVKDLHRRIRVFALLDTFEYIHRSGRVSWAKARLGSLLNIKPLIELKDGQVIQRGLARARSQGLKLLKNQLLQLGQLSEFAVLHTNADQEAQHLLKEFRDRTDCPPLLVHVTTIIGTHVGPRGLGFAAVVK